MRTFIALDLTHQACEKIYQFSQNLQKEMVGTKISWAKKNQFHVTLAFLKNINQEQQQAISQYLNELSLPSPFNFSLRAVDVFPHWHSPRVIWIGLSSFQPLIPLKKDIDHFLKSLHLPTDKRPFIPHITLGRVKKSLTKKHITALEEFKGIELIPDEQFEYLTFYQSKLSKEGARYIPLLRRRFPNDKK